MSSLSSTSRACQSKTSEVYTRAPVPNGGSGLFLPKQGEDALFLFVPAAVMQHGATTLDPRLFIADSDSRQLRTMVVLFMHLSNLIGEMPAPRDMPTIFSERLVLSGKGLPKHLDMENPDSQQMLEYAMDQPTSAVEGYVYTLRFAHDATVSVQKSPSTVAAEQSAEQKAYEEAKAAWSQESQGAPPKKKPVRRAASVPLVQAAMHRIYTTYADPKKADALDQEFMKLVPSHKELRAALYAYTRNADYVQAPCPSPDADFAKGRHLFNPLSIFTLENCRFKSYVIHPACLRDLYGGSWAPASLCRRVRPEEAAVDRFFRYRFLHYPEPAQSYDEIRAAISVDGMISSFLAGECKDEHLCACFNGYAREELKAFVTTTATDLPPTASARYAALKSSLQQAEFEANHGFYTGGLRSKSLSLADTTLEDLEQENKAAMRELKTMCAAFNENNSSNLELQRAHARFRRMTFQRKSFQRLVDVLEAGKVSETARLCFRYLKAYLAKTHNLYFRVRGGYGAYWQQQGPAAAQVSASSSASTSSACSRSAPSTTTSAAASDAASTSSSSSSSVTSVLANASGKAPIKLRLDRSAAVTYNLPSFARDMAGALDRYFAVAFSHRLTFEAFLRACYVFLDRPIYLNMLVSGAPGCGKSMIGVVLKELFPKGVVVDLSHMSPCALAVPNGPVRADQIFLLDEFGPQFMDPNSAVMRMLLSVLSGAEYGADVLDLNKETNERKNLQVHVRDRRTLFAFSNFSVKQIYPAMTDRMTCYTIAPSVAQVDAVQKCIQRAEQMLRDKAAQEEKQQFLESARLISCLMMMVSKMINVGILEPPSTSCAVDRVAALEDALSNMGVCLGSTRKRSVALGLLDVATLMDAVLRVFACGPEDARTHSVQTWESLLDVDPFLVPNEATQAFVLSLAHQGTEDRLQSAILDCLCGQVFCGPCEDHHLKRSVVSEPSQSQDEKDSKEEAHDSAAASNTGADTSIASYQPASAIVGSKGRRIVVDKDLLQHVQRWPARMPGKTAIERLAHALAQSPWISTAGDVTATAIESVLQRLCEPEQNITVPSAMSTTGRKTTLHALHLTELPPQIAVEEGLMSPLERAGGCHVDVLVLPAVVKRTKQVYVPRPVTAIREVFCNKFTVPGVYILGMEDDECAAKLRMELFESRSNVPIYKINPDHCFDETVREASLGLVPKDPESTIRASTLPVLGFPISQAQVEVTANPVQETLLARLHSLSISTQTQQQCQVFFDALLNSSQALLDAVACARQVSWAPTTALQVQQQQQRQGSNTGMAASTHQLAEELEAEQRRQQLRKSVDAALRQPKPRPGSLVDLLPEIESKKAKAATAATASVNTNCRMRCASEFETTELQHGFEMDKQENPKRARVSESAAGQSASTSTSDPSTASGAELEQDYLPNEDEESIAAAAV